MYNLRYVYEHIDKPLLQPLVEMEREGVLIDVPRLESLNGPIEREKSHLLDDIRYVAGYDINPNSIKQLPVLLYDQLGLPVHPNPELYRTANKEVLEWLRPYHDVVGTIINHRRITKQGQFVAAILNNVGADGRLRTHFNNTVVETGRLSSSDPINLQQIPKRIPQNSSPFISRVIRDIRKCFIARPGWSIVKFDQAAVEYRILVCLSNDEEMIEAIQRGQDPHLVTAARCLDISYITASERYKFGDSELKQMRDLSKNFNYGYAYGQTEVGFCNYANANGMPMNLDQAAEIHRQMTRPAQAAWIAKTKQFIRVHGYVTTYFGRVIKYPRPWTSSAQREGVNARIQGTSADVMKIAMRRIWDRKRGLTPTPIQILAVHDECVYESSNEHVDKLKEIIQKEAPSVIDDWPLRLEVEVGSGPNWAEASV